jgi:hypothetical protein
MEVIIPLESALAYTGSSPTYIYAVWVTATAYNAGDVRRYEVSTGVWRDFRCKIAHTSSASNAPGKTVYTWWWSTTYWDDLGPSSTSGGYTYTTNVRLSAYPAWATGAAVALNQAVYDAADNHDYIAVIAVSAGDNTVRPSDAINSADETLSARWLDLGASNAWAATDYLGNTYIEGYDASGNLVDPTLTVMLTCSSEVDRLCFAGLFNVKTLTTTVTDDGVARTATVTSLLPAGTTYGATHRTANIVHQPRRGRRQRHERGHRFGAQRRHPARQTRAILCRTGARPGRDRMGPGILHSEFFAQGARRDLWHGHVYQARHLAPDSRHLFSGPRHHYRRRGAKPAGTMGWPANLLGF